MHISLVATVARYVERALSHITQHCTQALREQKEVYNVKEFTNLVGKLDLSRSTLGMCSR